MMHIRPRPRRLLPLLASGLLLAACLGPPPGLAPAISEPNTRPARNFTSFAAALRCMDGLLARSGRPSVLISSNGFPDNTEDLTLGADDMLINAINQLNASNRKYVFLDQARHKDFGQLEILTVRKEDELWPQIYIRGSISQIDERTAESGLSTDLDGDSGANPVNAFFKGTRTLSVVSVDMHLVQYPSRRVVPGGSVANSMVVMQRRLDGSITGLVSRGTLGIPLYVERIESRSQAVRNLIEIGVIELLGRHSGVPYWTCLDTPANDARQNEIRERSAAHAAAGARLVQAQEMLVDLGLLHGHRPGQPDARTRRAISAFQTRHRLLPNGLVDFDTFEALKRQHARLPQPAPVAPVLPAAPTRPQVAPATPQTTQSPPRPSCAPASDCDEDYLNLYEFIHRL